MAIEPAEQYDPFLKKNVFGNILDQVDNYQYNLKLYMIPPVGQPVGNGSNVCPNVEDDVLLGEQRFNHVQPVSRINGEVFF